MGEPAGGDQFKASRSGVEAPLNQDQPSLSVRHGNQAVEQREAAVIGNPWRVNPSFSTHRATERIRCRPTPRSESCNTHAGPLSRTLAADCRLTPPPPAASPSTPSPSGSSPIRLWGPVRSAATRLRQLPDDNGRVAAALLPAACPPTWTQIEIPPFGTSPRRGEPLYNRVDLRARTPSFIRAGPRST